MRSETNKLIAIMEGHIYHSMFGMEFDYKEYDPVMFSNTKFNVVKNYFEFGVRFDPFGVKELKALLAEREVDLIIRNKSIDRPRNIRVIFNAKSNSCFLHILYTDCVFMERPTIITKFNLTNCEFM